MSKVYKHNGWFYMIQPDFVNGGISFYFTPKESNLKVGGRQKYRGWVEIDAENLEKSVVEAHQRAMNAIDNQKLLEELSELDLQSFVEFKRKVGA